MPIVAAYVYRDGQRIREAELTASGLKVEPNEFVWIGLREPQEAELRSKRCCQATALNSGA